MNEEKNMDKGDLITSQYKLIGKNFVKNNFRFEILEQPDNINAPPILETENGAEWIATKETNLRSNYQRLLQQLSISSQ